MRDWLYERQEQWIPYATRGLEEGLRAVGIDQTTLDGASKDSAVDERIRADFMGGVRSGVNDTPCFVVNGYCFQGTPGEVEVSIARLLERL